MNIATNTDSHSRPGLILSTGFLSRRGGGKLYDLFNFATKMFEKMEKFAKKTLHLVEKSVGVCSVIWLST